jgi:exopolyphosphatase/guanosine-5'-triphosphate,3'-diphosphate pyrophosphatase
MPGMRRRRIDLLPIGALVLATLAEVLDLDGYTLTDWGLREGVLLEAVGVEQ